MFSCSKWKIITTILLLCVDLHWELNKLHFIKNQNLNCKMLVNCIIQIQSWLFQRKKYPSGKVQQEMETSCVHRHEITKGMREEHLEMYIEAILLRSLNINFWWFLYCVKRKEASDHWQMDFIKLTFMWLWTDLGKNAQMWKGKGNWERYSREDKSRVQYQRRNRLKMEEWGFFCLTQVT